MTLGWSAAIPHDQVPAEPVETKASLRREAFVASTRGPERIEFPIEDFAEIEPYLDELAAESVLPTGS